MNTQLADFPFNPNRRDPLDFGLDAPSILDVGIAKLNWIFNIEIFTDGVDLSHWNWTEGREPDFGVLKANGFDFAIFKSTQGNWFKDKQFEPGWMAALDNDLVAMIYHFFQGNIGGAEQAHYCIDHSQPLIDAVDGRIIIWNDIERQYGERMDQRQNRARAFNQTVVEEGFQTGNYSSPSLWKSLMGSIALPWINDYWQWVAHWTPALSPTLPIGWTKARSKFWQYGISPTHSWAKKVGTDGNVDVIRFYGTLPDLKKLLGINPHLPSDCCDELQKRLIEVNELLSALNGRVYDVEKENSVLKQGHYLIQDHLSRIDTELNIIKNQVAYQGTEQTAMQTQIDILFAAAKQIKKSLP